MSQAKRELAKQGSIFKIGEDNPYLNHRVRATWLRRWGNREPGYTVTGILIMTFCVQGRTLIGEIVGKSDRDMVLSGDRKYSCPWSRKYLSVEVLD